MKASPVFAALCIVFLSSSGTAKDYRKPVEFHDLPIDERYCFPFGAYFSLQEDGAKDPTFERAYGEKFIRKEMVINSEQDYEKLLSIRRGWSCDKNHYEATSCSRERECLDVPLPKVDFSTTTLLGKWGEGGSCETSGFRKWVLKDEAGKRIDYIIQPVDEIRACMGMGFESMNFIAIPKVPEGYRVAFDPPAAGKGATIGPVDAGSGVGGISITEFTGGWFDSAPKACNGLSVDSDALFHENHMPQLLPLPIGIILPGAPQTRWESFTHNENGLSALKSSPSIVLNVTTHAYMLGPIFRKADSYDIHLSVSVACTPEGAKLVATMNRSSSFGKRRHTDSPWRPVLDLALDNIRPGSIIQAEWKLSPDLSESPSVH